MLPPTVAVAFDGALAPRLRFLQHGVNERLTDAPAGRVGEDPQHRQEQRVTRDAEREHVGAAERVLWAEQREPHRTSVDVDDLTRRAVHQ